MQRCRASVIAISQIPDLLPECAELFSGRRTSADLSAQFIGLSAKILQQRAAVLFFGVVFGELLCDLFSSSGQSGTALGTERLLPAGEVGAQPETAALLIVDLLLCGVKVPAEGAEPCGLPRFFLLKKIRPRFSSACRLILYTAPF